MKQLALAGLVALALPAQALAHASLEHTRPAFRERVATPPPAVRLSFDQKVKTLPGSIRVLTAGGTVVSGAAHGAGGGHDAVAPLPRLPKGPYTVRWHVVSGDGHVVSGDFTFGVRYPAPPP